MVKGMLLQERSTLKILCDGPTKRKLFPDRSREQIFTGFSDRFDFYLSSPTVRLFRYVCRALQFIPASTSPRLVREHFFTRNKSMFLARLYKDTNSSNTTKYITPICTYLYIIINALNETEHFYSP